MNLKIWRKNKELLEIIEKFKLEEEKWIKEKENLVAFKLEAEKRIKEIEKKIDKERLNEMNIEKKIYFSLIFYAIFYLN